MFVCECERERVCVRESVRKMCGYTGQQLWSLVCVCVSESVCVCACAGQRDH